MKQTTVSPLISSKVNSKKNNTKDLDVIIDYLNQ